MAYLYYTYIYTHIYIYLHKSVHKANEAARGPRVLKNTHVTLYREAWTRRTSPHGTWPTKRGLQKSCCPRCEFLACCPRVCLCCLSLGWKVHTEHQVSCCFAHLALCSVHALAAGLCPAWLAGNNGAQAHALAQPAAHSAGADAQDVEEVVAAVRDPKNHPSPLIAVGAMHSVTRCIEADAGTIVCMAGLDRVIGMAGAFDSPCQARDSAKCIANTEDELSSLPETKQDIKP